MPSPPNSGSRFFAWLAPLLLVVWSLGFHQVQAGLAKGLNVFLTADKATYAPGEAITFTLRVVNETSKSVRLSFLTSQRFDLVIKDQHGREVWRWSTGRLFLQVLGAETLEPSGGEFRAQVKVKEKFLPGSYEVTGIIPAQEGTLSGRTTLVIR